MKQVSWTNRTSNKTLPVFVVGKAIGRDGSDRLEVTKVAGSKYTFLVSPADVAGHS